jgi:hypothetical protein
MSHLSQRKEEKEAEEGNRPYRSTSKLSPPLSSTPPPLGTRSPSAQAFTNLDMGNMFNASEIKINSSPFFVLSSISIYVLV